MPLPGPDNANEAWPPAYLEPILRRIEVWAAWHSGDPDRLAAVYAGEADPDRSGFFASESGGFKSRVKRLVSNVVRYFWGTRSFGRPRRRLHVPVAGDIASASADLLFSEPPTITVDDEAAQKTLDAIMDEGAHAALLEGAETAAALSGVFLRARWDTEARETPWFDVVAPDCAVPEWDLGRLAACTFWRIIDRKGRTVYRHLERHEPGYIEHAVYAGTDELLGLPVAGEDGRPGLAGFAATAALADVVDDAGLIPTGTDRLTVEYVPNMRPNRIWRTIAEAAHLGVSDYSGLEGLMDALDLAYSSLIRDVDLGKARLIVPRQYMNDHGRGQGASLDLDREVYEPIGAMAGEEGIELREIQFKIRVDEHEKVIARLKLDVVTSAGYSAQTFGIGDAVAVTATEVTARERRSLITRDRKTMYWGPALRGILETLLEIAGHAGAEVNLEWPSAVSVDPEAEARTVREWDTARAASTATRVRKLHPEWTDPEVDEEVERILRENNMGPLEDPDTFDADRFTPPGDRPPAASAEADEDVVDEAPVGAAA